MELLIAFVCGCIFGVVTMVACGASVYALTRQLIGMHMPKQETVEAEVPIADEEYFRRARLAPEDGGHGERVEGIVADERNFPADNVLSYLSRHAQFGGDE